MEKLFWENPYLTEIKTKILEQKGDIIKLESTIVFPFSGGAAVRLGFNRWI